MRIKRLLAGLMAFVLSLNLVHINVNAKVDSEDLKEKENVTDVINETSRREVTTGYEDNVSEVDIERVANGVVNLLFKGWDLLVDFGMEKIPNLINYVIKYTAMGCCIGLGIIIVDDGLPVRDAVRTVRSNVEEYFEKDGE